jgi:NADPH:quinone reductase-like Zn-dependent oxidoreductase
VLAVLATSTDPLDPLSGLRVADHPMPVAPPGWVLIAVRAAALNHHDLWTLRGVGVDERRLPIVLGCDASGVAADGTPVIVHAVVTSDPSGDETLADDRSLLSEVHDGTMAQWVAVPARNVVPKPAVLPFVEASCLPTAWLTAYRMLFTQAQVRPGQRVLVQGAGGGVATAAVMLARAAGAHVTVAARDPHRLARAVELGAHEAVGSGDRLPRRVHAVIDTVGTATLDHSLRSLESGGVVVVSGATAGHLAAVDLRRLFFRQLRLLGSTMGTKAELVSLVRFVIDTDLVPPIDTVLPIGRAPEAFARLASGEAFGKVVLEVA